MFPGLVSAGVELLGAQVIVRFLMATVGSIILVVVGTLAYDTALPLPSVGRWQPSSWGLSSSWPSASPCGYSSPAGPVAGLADLRDASARLGRRSHRGWHTREQDVPNSLSSLRPDNTIRPRRCLGKPGRRSHPGPR